MGRTKDPLDKTLVVRLLETENLLLGKDPSETLKRFLSLPSQSRLNVNEAF